jgi:hypothetical protein
VAEFFYCAAESFGYSGRKQNYYFEYVQKNTVGNNFSLSKTCKYPIELARLPGGRR